VLALCGLIVSNGDRRVGIAARPQIRGCALCDTYQRKMNPGVRHRPHRQATLLGTKQQAHSRIRSFSFLQNPGR